MLKYVLRRFCSAVLSLFIIVTVMFCLLRMMPIEGYLGANVDKMSPEVIAAKLAAKQAEEEAANADPEIDALVAARTEAKKAKNWAEADRIRDELKARGIEIIDTPQGAKWRKV